MPDKLKVQTTIVQMRALIRQGRERIYALRPAWGVHLADQAMCRLAEAVDQLEAAIGAEGSEPRAVEGGRPVLATGRSGDTQRSR